ncbi:hypothetical protein F7725_023378, partial [Dissostichus mawsoni]
MSSSAPAGRGGGARCEGGGEDSPRRDEETLVHPDCCGIVCAFITWFLVFYADFVVTFVMLLPSRSFWYAVINGVLFNSLAGAVPKGNATKKYVESLQLKPGEIIYKCAKCCSIKPERAHHC